MTYRFSARWKRRTRDNNARRFRSPLHLPPPASMTTSSETKIPTAACNSGWAAAACQCIVCVMRRTLDCCVAVVVAGRLVGGGRDKWLLQCLPWWVEQTGGQEADWDRGTKWSPNPPSVSAVASHLFAQPDLCVTMCRLCFHQLGLFCFFCLSTQYSYCIHTVYCIHLQYTVQCACVCDCVWVCVVL